MTDIINVQSTEPGKEGYREFTLGGFNFRRDEFFVHVNWPTGSHVMSADTFLRALQRDIAWDFFYGTVNFDAVVGTVNHYGTVDLFGGRFNESYRKAELDHLENFPSDVIRETFKAIIDDWTNADFDPFASPAETGNPFGVKDGSNTDAVTRRRVAANRLVSLPGDEQIRTDATRRAPGRANRGSGTWLRKRGRRLQPVCLHFAQRRDVEPVGGIAVQGQPLLPYFGGVHPSGHPR
jgi:Hydroquinone 1,2-dioxygenase large subunit N-terminal